MSAAIIEIRPHRWSWKVFEATWQRDHGMNFPRRMILRFGAPV